MASKHYSVHLNIVPIYAGNVKWAIHQVRQMFNLPKHDDKRFNSWLIQVQEVQPFVTEEGKVMYEYVGNVYE